uniref:Uncharacterized protein n=1 Tax=Arundo donax TaxID=35708 RepID=A0A0A9CE33_ARUDO
MAMETLDGVSTVGSPVAVRKTSEVAPLRLPAEVSKCFFFAWI